MSFRGKFLKFLAAAWLGGGLAACSHLHLTQEEHQVLTRTGDEDNFAEKQQAGPVAARVLPYALLAEQSYVPGVYAGEAVRPVRRDCIADDPQGCEGLPQDRARAAAWLAEWRNIWHCDGPDQCGTQTIAGDAVDGLGVQIWARRGPVCGEAVIAFRGTVAGNEGDWASNFRWVLRGLPLYDQYDQVRDHIGDFIARIEREPCFRSGARQITTVGHSLGGGLAQIAGYASHRVRRIYTFDPSMVTGYYSGGLIDRDRNVIGLRSERIYEHGEILAYGRYVMRQFYPPTACNPRIVNIRFQVLHGSPIGQHSLTSFTTALLREAHGHAPERNPIVLRPCGPAEAGKSKPQLAAQ